jgi:hypothetical protein
MVTKEYWAAGDCGDVASTTPVAGTAISKFATAVVTGEYAVLVGVKVAFTA